MREPPADLVELRALVAATEGWWRKGRRVTEAARQKMSDTQRAECHWHADPQLTDRLMAAEKAFTATFEREKA